MSNPSGLVGWMTGAGPVHGLDQEPKECTPCPCTPRARTSAWTPPTPNLFWDHAMWWGAGGTCVVGWHGLQLVQDLSCMWHPSPTTPSMGMCCTLCVEEATTCNTDPWLNGVAPWTTWNPSSACRPGPAVCGSQQSGPDSRALGPIFDTRVLEGEREILE